MSLSVLVVVDVQREYRAASDPAYRREVRRIIRAHPGPVVLLEMEYDLGGVSLLGTWPDVERAFLSRRRRARAWKSGDDGGAQVAGVARRAGWEADEFALVGVNTGCCVARTASGLLWATGAGVRVGMVRSGCRDQLDCRRGLATQCALGVWLAEDRDGRRFVRW